ncbi:MAG TPA: hypothetical protein VM681_11020 [Candidatus Thermoplasmatota archaeon]|nr:hypothetical protein [Candidatus Thermoplasmatota archaeon]
MSASFRPTAAFAPAHVSGFFEIHDENPDALRRGSRGAGVCLATGAVSHVTVETAPAPKLAVFVNGEPDPAPVTSYALRALLGRSRLAVTVRTELAFPVGQGFGMSAAGALSAALALAKQLGQDRYAAARAAHQAELANRSGLGDVAAALHGGVAFRRAPGLPPFGAVDRVVADARLLALPMGEGIPTPSVLSDPAARSRVAAVGSRCVEAFRAQPTLPNLFRVSRQFARDCGFTTPSIERVLSAVESTGGLALQAMLGTSVVAYGEDTELLADVLREFGEPLPCEIDEGGARLLTVEKAPRT